MRGWTVHDAAGGHRLRGDGPFRVRYADFSGTADPDKAPKTTLKAEVDQEARESLRRARSRPFPRHGSGRGAVKVIQPSQ